jgi:HK97 gp10 family phage protein
VADDDVMDVTFTGVDDVVEALNKLPYELAKTAMRQSLAAGGEEFLHAMQSTVPIGTDPEHAGTLRDALSMKITTHGDLDENVVSVGPRYDKSKLGKTKSGDTDFTKSPGVYGFFVEVGTSKMSGRHWIRSAYEAAKERAVAAFGKRLGQSLSQIVASLRKRT